MRAALKWIGGFLLTALLLGWVLRRVEIGAVRAQLGGASLPLLTLGAILNFAHNPFRVWRWRTLLSPVRAGVPFRPMFAAIILGYATSWLVPGRLGEIVRPALLSARERLPFGACLGTVVADRLLDGLAVLGLFAAGIALTPLVGESLAQATRIRNWSLAVVGLVLVPLAFLLVVSSYRSRLEGWVQGLGGRVGTRIGGAVLALSHGIEALRRPRLLLPIVAHTVAAWMLIVAGTWLGVRACGADVGLGSVLVILPLLALGIALPTPGGAGGYHAAMVFGLTRLFGVDEPVAVGASFAMHAAIVLPVIVGAGLLVVLEGIPVATLVRAVRRAATAGDAGRGGPEPRERAP